MGSGFAASPYPPLRQGLVLVGFLVATLAVGYLGSLVTAPAVAEWYPTLTLPDWRPPNSLFAPVWTALYVLMAVAAWLVWRKRPWPEPRGALVLFALQLAANFAWSFLFFGARSPLLGLLDIALLLALILLTLAAFWRHDRLAGALFVPYLAWVAFATALNAWIFLEN